MRIERFRRLASKFGEVRDLLVEVEINPGDFQPGWRATVTAECTARLRDLGVEFGWPALPSDEYIQMIVLMERGGLREAQRRWPIRPPWPAGGSAT